MRLRSLRLQLIVGLLVPILALVAIDSVLTYNNARQAANLAYDRTLLASARAIAERVTVTQGRVDVDIPVAALEMFESQHQDRVYYRVAVAGGEAISGYDLPEPPAPLRRRGDAVAYLDTAYRGMQIREAALYRPLFSVGERVEGPIVVQVAETLSSRNALTFSLFGRQLLQQGAYSVLIIVFVWVMIGVALRPVRRVANVIAARDEVDLGPFEMEPVKTELRPLVAALNQYMLRLKRQVESQQRFIADASHQLRTPVTLFKTQVDYALTDGSATAMRSALTSLRLTADEMARLINQLLTLSRASDDPHALDNVEVLDLNELAREVCLRFTAAAREKAIDLGLCVAEAPAHVSGSRELLLELAANLVDNAVRYSPHGSSVTVSVNVSAATADLVVVDDGPGVPPSRHGEIFERFYRILGTGVAGSGLGLAIVKEIALRHKATIALENVPGHGLGVTVSVPRA